MKTLATIVILGLAGAGYGETLTYEKDGKVYRQVIPPVPRKAAPNRIIGRKTNVSGVLPLLAKARHPFHVLNPAAPAEYGDGRQNVARNVITGEAEGIVVLAIEF